MGFIKALFYPSIEIEDREWLKSAILFWDEICTIVRESCREPIISYNQDKAERIRNNPYSYLLNIQKQI